MLQPLVVQTASIGISSFLAIGAYAVSTPSAQTAKQIRMRRFRNVIVSLLVIGVGIAVWDEVFKYRFFAKRFGVVVPGKIYRSGQISKWMIEPTLEKHNVQLVVDLTSFDPNIEDQHAELEATRRLGIEHVRYPMSGDGVGSVDQYADVIEILHKCEQESKPVLVHCAAGAQRTGGVVASYRLLVHEQTREQAIAEMEKYGWSGGDNAKLLTFLDGQMEELAQKLVAKGVLEQMPNPLPFISDAGPIKNVGRQAAAEDTGTQRL